VMGLNCGGTATPSTGSPGGSSSSGGAGSSGSGSGSSSGAGGSSSGSSSGSGGNSGSSSGAGSSGSSSGSSSGGSGSGGSSGSSGGSSSGSSSGGGDGGTSGAGPLVAMDNQWWLLKCGQTQSYSDLVCVNQPAANCNGTNPYLTRGTINRDQTITVGGDGGTTYMVTAHFQGVVEPKTYQGGTKANPTVKTDGWYVDGTPSQSGNYNVYMLGVSSPAHVYYLNALGNSNPKIAEAHFSYLIDYVATFPVQGGAMVRFLADDSNCSAIKNCDAASTDGSGGTGHCNPITVPNVTAMPPATGETFVPATALPFSQPYNGQFVVMTIQSVQ
jgi:hypothetical protein